MEDYKKRFVEEYRQLEDRYKKLQNMIVKYRAKTLDFEPDCPLSLLQEQLFYMGGYLEVLKVRAEIEEVDLA